MTASRHRTSDLLYQLATSQKLIAGEYVQINGPFDTFGYVVKSTQRGSTDFLNLIRGCAPRQGVRPSVTF